MSRWASDAIGPIIVVSWAGSPTVYAPATATARATISSWSPAGTSRRGHEPQTWPPLVKAMATPVGTATSRSAPGRITLAPLPPSSRATRLTVPAATAPMRRPARVEPVKEIMSMPGWAEIASPTTSPVPYTTLRTPAGRPASSVISSRIAGGERRDLRRLPDDRVARDQRGGELGDDLLEGKFHGVMAPTTPIGSRTISEVPSSSVQAKVSARAANDWATATGNWICAVRARLIGAPISAVMTAASSSARARMPAPMRPTIGGPVEGAGRGPGGERGAGGGHRPVDVGGGAGGHLGDHVAGGGIEDGDG